MSNSASPRVETPGSMSDSHLRVHRLRAVVDRRTDDRTRALPAGQVVNDIGAGCSMRPVEKAPAPALAPRGVGAGPLHRATLDLRATRLREVAQIGGQWVDELCMPRN